MYLESVPFLDALTVFVFRFMSSSHVFAFDFAFAFASRGQGAATVKAARREKQSESSEPWATSWIAARCVASWAAKRYFVDPVAAPCDPPSHLTALCHLRTVHSYLRRADCCVCTFFWSVAEGLRAFVVRVELVLALSRCSLSPRMYLSWPHSSAVPTSSTLSCWGATRSFMFCLSSSTDWRAHFFFFPVRSVFRYIVTALVVTHTRFFLTVQRIYPQSCSFSRISVFPLPPQASLELEQERTRSLQQEVAALKHDLDASRATEAVAERQRQEHAKMAADSFGG